MGLPEEYREKANAIQICYEVQSTKILLLPSKCEIIFVIL